MTTVLWRVSVSFDVAGVFGFDLLDKVEAAFDFFEVYIKGVDLHIAFLGDMVGCWCDMKGEGLNPRDDGTFMA